ncbi:hypothetical protein BS47DRAFT_1360649, partial [Hydnum rufescens UP504]
PAKQNRAKLHDTIPNETTPNENAPPEWPCEPHTRYGGCVVVLVRAVTQAQSARPLNTTIDEIAYHTPAAAARKPPQKKGTCAATRNPQPDPRVQRPNTRTYATTDEIQYHTPAAAGCVVIARLSSMHETPPNKNTDGKPMWAATRNPIQEPATASQNEYHTPASAGVWYYKVFLLIQIQAPEMTTCDPRLVQTTRPTVNRRAQPPVPHTRPSGDGTTPAQAGVVLLSNSTIHPLGWAQGVY